MVQMADVDIIPKRYRYRHFSHFGRTGLYVGSGSLRTGVLQPIGLVPWARGRCGWEWHARGGASGWVGDSLFGGFKILTISSLGLCQLDKAQARIQKTLYRGPQDATNVGLKSRWPPVSQSGRSDIRNRLNGK
jgi:hypothetical protein